MIIVAVIEKFFISPITTILKISSVSAMNLDHQCKACTQASLTLYPGFFAYFTLGKVLKEITSTVNVLRVWNIIC